MHNIATLLENKVNANIEKVRFCVLIISEHLLLQYIVSSRTTRAALWTWTGTKKLHAAVKLHTGDEKKQEGFLVSRVFKIQQPELRVSENMAHNYEKQ